VVDPGGGTSTGGVVGGTGSTTTMAPGSTPTTTVVTKTPTTTTTPTTTPTTTTTNPSPPPLDPPRDLEATSGCQVLVIGPDVTLSWEASPTTTVTGYVILRGRTNDALSPVGSVSGRSTTFYTDTAVSGLGTTYWYEVEAVAGGATAVSSAAWATTPSLCVSSPG
jgi:hypothetical protein